MPDSPYYSADGITILHADCRDVLPGMTADAIITDPPYGVGFDYHEHDDEPADYDAFLTSVAPLIFDAAPLVMLTPGIGNLWRWPPARWVLCWYKPGASGRMALAQPLRPQGGFNQWEPVLVYGAARFIHDTLYCPTQSPGGRTGEEKGTGIHPCPKPLRLMRWLVDGATEPGELIIDPFMGTGTTLRAALDAGRRAIGIEVDERYCEIAANRLAQGSLFSIADEQERRRG